MPLAALNQNDVALIGRALHALAAGDVVSKFEFGAEWRWPTFGRCSPDGQRGMTLMTAPRSVLRSTTHSTTFCTALVCRNTSCLLYTSDAADERSSVDLGG